MPDYRFFDVTVTTLTPLHIGSGRDLLHEYDYAIHKGHTWRLNEDALLDVQDVDDLALVARLARTPPARLLDRAKDFQIDAPFFRYVIRGTPRSKAEGAQVREQLKDIYDRIYLPGTSLKGALRTALAWYAWGERGMRPERNKLGRSRKFAARRYEQEIFGRDPNHDLLRALHVGDSGPVGTDRLMLINARVLNASGQVASPIELEAIQPETTFRLSFKLDEALFSDWAVRRGLNLHGREWLEKLAAVVRKHTDQRLDEEAAWFAHVAGAQAIASFYRQLQRSGRPHNGFLLQLGWGTGWDGKTFGSRLRADRDFMEGILRPPREGGYGLARGRRQPGDPFPRSRRVVVKVARGPDSQVRESPVAPLGWVLVELRPWFKEVL